MNNRGSMAMENKVHYKERKSSQRRMQGIRPSRHIVTMILGL